MKSRFTKHVLAITAGIVISTCAIGQIAMVRTTFTGSYTPLTTGSGGGTMSTAFGDDQVQANIPLGFTFNYLGTNYTALDISTNGVAAFNGFLISGTTRNNADFYSTVGPNALLCPWMDDLTSDSMVYATTGTPGTQVMTVQWYAKSYYTGSTQLIRFQMKLYEGTNVIEFLYGSVTSGTVNTSESATIGIESATGGSGNYIDAVTGSSFVGSFFLESTNKWPTVNYRFTPGLPVAVAPGTYTVGAAGNYPTIDQAVADLNHRGVAGPVVLSLTQATYDHTVANGRNIFPLCIGPIAGTSVVNTVMIMPASGTSTFSYFGETAGGIASGGSSSALTTTSEPIVAVCGAKYVGMMNIALTATNANVDRGLMVFNQTSTNGTQNCGFTNISVQLVRTNTSSIAIQQNVVTTPTSAAGANSNNAYMNLSVSNTYAGIYLLGNATFPDLGCVVGNTSPTAFNTIGSTTANDIGGGTTQTYGIRFSNQSGASMYNNEVRNVSGSAATTDGILIELSQGTSSCYNNRVYNIRGISTTSTVGVTGIRANVQTSTGHTLRVYNNAVYGITSAYTGAATATRQVKGIFAQSAGGGVVTSSVNIDHNNVYLDLSSNPNISSTCYEIGTTSGCIINTRNNIFVNATGAQTAPATHFTWRSTSATLVGNTGSVSDRNDLYIVNATQGFVGQGNATNYATLANWQAGMIGQDVNSVSVDPQFYSTTDLHVAAGALDNVASSLAWVTVDFDNQLRSGTPDIGADEFAAATNDIGATLLVTPVAGACYTSTESVTIRIRNYATVTHDFAVNPVTITVNVTGATTATLNFIVNSGTLASFTNLDVVVGTINMTTAGTYTFNATAAAGGDQNPTNDAMAQTSIDFLAGTATSTPTSMCLGGTTNLSLTGNSSTSIQWQESFDNGVTWNNIVGATTNPYTHTPTDSVLVRALVCGLITSVFDTVLPIYVGPPTVVNDTACGLGSVTLTASGTGTLQWYTAATGGTLVNTGGSYTTNLTATDTFYVQASSGASAATHITTYAAGNGSSGNCFTVKALTTLTITSFDGHLSSSVGTPSTWEIWYRPNDYLLSPGSHLSNVGWTQLGTGSVNSAGPGNPTPIPVALSVQIPAGATYSFQIFTTTGSVSYTNGTVLGALYNANTDLEVYQGHGGTAFSGMVNQPRVFNGTIHYSTGCESTRVPVIGVISPAPAVTATASNANVCSGNTTTLVSGSSNPGYEYTWSPAASLNTPNGDTVIATPTGNTVYVVTAMDSVSGCVDTAQVSIMWAQSPQVTATVAPDTICSGASVNLDAPYTGSATYIVGTGTITNTATSYPAPYGNYYWGSRHQMLVLASELTAAGMNAGYINSLAFNVASINATQPLDMYEVKIGTTALNSITTFQGGLTSVFFAPSYMPVNGPNQHFFSTPFYWDGVSNIIIETCHNNASYIDNASMYQSTTAFSSTVYFRQDAAGVCANNTVTGTATQRPNMRFTMLASYDYAWTPAASLNDSTLQNPIGMPMMTTNYVVAVTDSINGCVSWDTVTVVVNMTPAPMFGADTNICSNASLMLDGTSGSNYAYLWQDMSTSQMYTVTAAGTYDVTVTDTLTGCVGADTITVGIDVAPAFSLGNDTTVCSGQMVTFNGPVDPNYWYMWSNGDTTVSTTTGTGGAHELVVTDTTNGCFERDTVMLNLNALPPVDLGADTTICSNTGMIMISGPSGAYDYAWSTGDTTQTISIGTAGNYSVVVTDLSTSCADADTLMLTINMAPSFSLGGDTTFCSNNAPVVLWAPSGPYMYMWSDMSTADSLAVTTAGVYSVMVTDSTNGCSETDSLTAIVNMSPSFTVNDTTDCAGAVLMTGPSGPYSYAWSTPGTGQTQSISLSGSYTLTVTDTTTGCDGMDAFTVTLNSAPAVSASASATSVCADDANVTLTGSPAGGMFFGTSVSGNQFDPSVGAGTYSIIYDYTDSNGCSASDTISVNVSACVGIAENSGVNNISVYPNPSNEYVNILFNNSLDGNVTLELFDVQGKVVQSQRMENIAGGAIVVFNMTNYESGLYTLRVTKDDGSTESFRLSVQH